MDPYYHSTQYGYPNHFGGSILLNPGPNAPAAIVGGLLIGLSSTLYLLFTGRIAGISGIIEGLVTWDPDTIHFKAAFIAGLIHGVSILSRLTGIDFRQSVDPHLNNLPIIVVFLSGLLVGFGTRLGNGCTSGHGVCGLPRKSGRSFVNVMTFFLTAIVVATVYGSASGRNSRFPVPDPLLNQSKVWYVFQYIVSSFAFFIGLILLKVSHSYSPNNWRDSLITYGCAAIFSMGLCISGMSKPSKVVNFLAIGPHWDYSLLFVLASAVGFNLISFHLIKEKVERPLITQIWKEDHPEENYSFPTVSNKIDLHLIFGGFVFGLGWGLSGICPGPAVLLLVSGSLPTAFVFIPAMFWGMNLAVQYKSNIAIDATPLLNIFKQFQGEKTSAEVVTVSN